MDAQAVEGLLDQALKGWDTHVPDVAREAASRAVEAAEQLGDPALLVRALDAEAHVLFNLFDFDGAFAQHTRVLALAEDPATRDRLTGPATAELVAWTYLDWMNHARIVAELPALRLFEVLDAAERWLADTGHHEGRAAVLSHRAEVHRDLGEWATAIVVAEEALAVHEPGELASIPGLYDLAGHRLGLGTILREAGRPADAEPHFQATLDDPGSSPHDRLWALEGLARCALDRDDPERARSHATAAVQVAELIDDNALYGALDVQVAVYRATGDLDAAWQSVTRQVDLTRRGACSFPPFHATDVAVEIAMDRGDLDSTRRLLDDLDTQAVEDADRDEVALLRQRLAELDPSP